MKALHLIQKIIGFLKYLFKLLFIFCLVILVIETLIDLFLIVSSFIPYNDTNFAQFCTSYYDKNAIEVLSSCLQSTVDYVMFSVLCKFLLDYFTTANEDKTPFSYLGAYKLKSVSYMFILFPIVAYILQCIISFFLKTPLSTFPLGLMISGIIIYFVSQVFSYGATLQEENDHYKQVENLYKQNLNNKDTK